MFSLCNVAHSITKCIGVYLISYIIGVEGLNLILFFYQPVCVRTCALSWIILIFL